MNHAQGIDPINIKLRPLTLDKEPKINTQKTPTSSITNEPEPIQAPPPRPQTIDKKEFAPRGTTLDGATKTFTFQLSSMLKSEMKAYCRKHDVSYAQMIRKAIKDLLINSGY